MFYNYISPYKIIYFIGIIGSIMTLIAFIFVDIFECKGKEENIKNYCVVTKKDKNNSTKYYYDNIIVYFDEIKNHKYNYKFFFEIIIITPFYLAINFFGFVCEILIIYYLNPIYVLVRENLYYCLQRFVFILVNLDNYNNYISLSQFIILQISEITALLGYAVYLEIIELKFCNLDKDLKRNIIERGERETIMKPIENKNDDDENNDDDSFEDEML